MSQELTFAPLEYPNPWPPPHEVSTRTDEFPILGRVWRFATKVLWCDPHTQLMFDIEEQILAQLKVRPKVEPKWPPDPKSRAIAEALAEAVRSEKGLDHVALHPLDPASVLFWGAYDDLTPLVFNIELDLIFESGLRPADWEAIFWSLVDYGKVARQGPTVAQIVARCRVLLEHSALREHKLDRLPVSQEAKPDLISKLADFGLRWVLPSIFLLGCFANHWLCGTFMVLAIAATWGWWRWATRAERAARASGECENVIQADAHRKPGRRS